MDFEDLAFSGEGHFMANRKVQLPPGSQRNSFKVRSCHPVSTGMHRLLIHRISSSCFQGTKPLV